MSKVKVTFGVDTRVWRASEPTFSGLLAFVQDVWGESLPQQWRLSYTDTDGDLVTIASQIDLAESLQTLSGDSQRQVRINVLGANPSSRPATIHDAFMNDDDTETDYEIVRGGSPDLVIQEVVPDDQVAQHVEQPQAPEPVMMSEEKVAEEEAPKEEEPKEKSEAHNWAEERINAGRIPTVEQLITRFGVTLDHANSVMTALQPGIQTLQALLGTADEEPSRLEGQESPEPIQEQPERPKSPSEMDADELRGLLLQKGFKIQGNEDALRMAVRALSDPNITVEATAYVEPNSAGQPRAQPANCKTKEELIAEFFANEAAQEELVGPFVDVLHASFTEGEDPVVCVQSAVAACENLAQLGFVQKLLPFLPGYRDVLKKIFPMVMVFGPDAARNLLRTAITAFKSEPSGLMHNPMFAMFKPFCKDIRGLFDEFAKSTAPDVRRDDQGRVIHMGVVCDGCGMDPICGVRWKSCSRTDYDLCDNCEAKRGDRHNPMIKYEYPSQSANQQLPGLREAFRHNKCRGKGGCPWKKGKAGGCRGWRRWAKGQQNSDQSGPETPGADWQQHIPPFVRDMMNGGHPHHPPHHGPRGRWGRGRGGRGRGRGFFRNFWRNMNNMWQGQEDGQRAANESTDANGVKTAVVHEYHPRNITGVGQIISAAYGVPGSAPSVLDQVNQVHKDGVIHLVGVRSLNQHFGDPAVGQVKKLTIQYRPAAENLDSEVYNITVDTKPMGFRFDGVKVTHVFPWGHAGKAGMKPGDSILMVNGQDVDNQSLQALYDTARVPFDMVLSRQVVKKKLSKEEKLAKAQDKIQSKIEKVSKKLEQADRKAEKQAKKLEKQSSILAKQANNLQKQKQKLESGKGNPKKLVKQMAKGAIKLVKKQENLEKREQKHSEFVNRLERQKEKMQAKLKKMEAKLAKVSSKKAAITDADMNLDSSSSDEAMPPAGTPDLPKEEPKAVEPTAAELVFRVAVDHPYYEQNQALVQMGFADERNNMHVLAQSDGNLPRAITMLCERANN